MADSKRAMIREDLPSAQFQKQQKQKIGPLAVIFLEKFATVGEFLSGKVTQLVDMKS